MWAQMQAPPIAANYWKLPVRRVYINASCLKCTLPSQEGAMMRDVILVIRADEAHHRLVNHTLSSMAPNKDNPFGPGQ